MFRGGKILAPSPINFAWWAELNDTTLDFLAPPEHPKTPLPVGHPNLFWIRLLSDDRVEVRESAANTLSNLLDCELILITDKLIKEFEINANHKYAINGFKSIDPKLMAIKHSWILGLCACINAYPYEVPYFIPDIILFLTSTSFVSAKTEQKTSKEVQRIFWLKPRNISKGETKGYFWWVYFDNRAHIICKLFFFHFHYFW